MNLPIEERLLNVKEVAYLLGLSVSSVKRLIYDGKLTALRVSKRALRVTASSVDLHIEAQKEQYAADEGIPEKT